MSDEPGFDFIKLTRPQWRWLASMQRKHGIAWHQYIKILIQRDMDRVVNGEEAVRPAPMEGRREITPDAVNKILEKVQLLLDRPIQTISVGSPIAEGAKAPPNIIEEGGLKPSQLKKVKAYAPGTRQSLMDEMHQKLGLPPPGSKKKIKIEFSESIEFVENEKTSDKERGSNQTSEDSNKETNTE